MPCHESSKYWSALLDCGLWQSFPHSPPVLSIHMPYIVNWSLGDSFFLEGEGWGVAGWWEGEERGGSVQTKIT